MARPTQVSTSSRKSVPTRKSIAERLRGKLVCKVGNPAATGSASLAESSTESDEEDSESESEREDSEVEEGASVSDGDSGDEEEDGADSGAEAGEDETSFESGGVAGLEHDLRVCYDRLLRAQQGGGEKLLPEYRKHWRLLAQHSWSIESPLEDYLQRHHEKLYLELMNAAFERADRHERVLQHLKPLCRDRGPAPSPWSTDLDGARLYALFGEKAVTSWRFVSGLRDMAELYREQSAQSEGQEGEEGSADANISLQQAVRQLHKSRRQRTRTSDRGKDYRGVAKQSDWAVWDVKHATQELRNAGWRMRGSSTAPKSQHRARSQTTTSKTANHNNTARGPQRVHEDASSTRAAPADDHFLGDTEILRSDTEILQSDTEILPSDTEIRAPQNNTTTPTTVDRRRPHVFTKVAPSNARGVAFGHFLSPEQARGATFRRYLPDDTDASLHPFPDAETSLNDTDTDHLDFGDDFPISDDADPADHESESQRSRGTPDEDIAAEEGAAAEHLIHSDPDTPASNHHHQEIHPSLALMSKRPSSPSPADTSKRPRLTSDMAITQATAQLFLDAFAQTSAPELIGAVAAITDLPPSTASTASPAAASARSGTALSAILALPSADPARPLGYFVAHFDFSDRISSTCYPITASLGQQEQAQMKESIQQAWSAFVQENTWRHDMPDTCEIVQLPALASAAAQPDSLAVVDDLITAVVAALHLFLGQDMPRKRGGLTMWSRAICAVAPDDEHGGRRNRRFSSRLSVFPIGSPPALDSTPLSLASSRPVDSMHAAFQTVKARIKALQDHDTKLSELSQEAERIRDLIVRTKANLPTTSESPVNHVDDQVKTLEQLMASADASHRAGYQSLIDSLRSGAAAAQSLQSSRKDSLDKLKDMVGLDLLDLGDMSRRTVAAVDELIAEAGRVLREQLSWLQLQ